MEGKRKKIVIIGATSGIAEHCARLWLAMEATDMLLVGRDLDKLEMVAADLRVRSAQSAVRVRTADFEDPAKIAESVDRIFAEGGVDIALVAHGLLPDQQHCQQDLAACADALAINGVSPVLFAEAFAGQMQRANAGTLAVIGSVAGDRGRKSNYVYGAAKGLVDRYAQGLQHRLAATAVKVVLIKPGPTDTPMTAHLKQQGARLANPQEVAKSIVQAITKGKSCVYVPGRWWLIMMVIRHLPKYIFNKLNI